MCTSLSVHSFSQLTIAASILIGIGEIVTTPCIIENMHEVLLQAGAIIINRVERYKEGGDIQVGESQTHFRYKRRRCYVKPCCLGKTLNDISS